jgi:hypothetical protein
MTTPWLGDLSAATQPAVITLQLIAYKLESRVHLDDAWAIEALDAISGPSVEEVARGLCRDYALEHPDRWVQVSTWDLTLFLRGLVLPERPSTRLAWLQSLDDENVRPHCQTLRSPAN